MRLLQGRPQRSITTGTPATQPLSPPPARPRRTVRGDDAVARVAVLLEHLGGARPEVRDLALVLDHEGAGRAAVGRGRRVDADAGRVVAAVLFCFWGWIKLCCRGDMGVKDEQRRCGCGGD